MSPTVLLAAMSLGLAVLTSSKMTHATSLRTSDPLHSTQWHETQQTLPIVWESRLKS